MLTLFSFLFVLGVLITIHEYGHYKLARLCGVKVLKFSVGFGRPLWSRTDSKTGTIYAVGWIPLGGYVQMLDARNGPVDPKERHLEFTAKPLMQRVAVVAAGPLANLIVAVALYSLLGWVGQREALPVLATPLAGSMAERAGFSSGDRVLALSRVDSAGSTTHAQAVVSFEQLSWLLTRAAIDGQDVQVQVQPSATSAASAGVQRLLPLSRIDTRMVDAQLLRQVGLIAPFSQPVIGEVQTGAAASAAGLRPGDRVVQVEGRIVPDALALREHIRATPERTQLWRIERAGQPVELTITPARVAGPAQNSFGRIGAVVGASPATQHVSQGFFGGLAQGFERTWDAAVLSLTMLGKMLVGEASIKNLSGPLTIADYAGKSAQMGLWALLGFMALVSVSLGVLNLLPLPVLDGGHLLYYLWEGIVGKPVSELWQQRFQQGGIAVLLLMMSVALFNDVSRLVG